MTVLASPATTIPHPSTASGVRRSALLAGILAGPLFVTTATAQILTRDGFDLTRHPISLLANGEHGWVQSANFVVAGLLSLVFAYGVGPYLRGGRGTVAVPVLLTVHGVGLITGGIFKADAAMGFPVGAPAGYPEQISTPGIIHAFAPLGFLALVAACLVLARRFAAAGDRPAAILTVVVAVACFLLPLPFGPLHSVRLFVAVVLGFAWITAFAVRLRSRA